jgi:hypothetical protein
VGEVRKEARVAPLISDAEMRSPPHFVLIYKHPQNCRKSAMLQKCEVRLVHRFSPGPVQHDRRRTQPDPTLIHSNAQVGREWSTVVSQFGIARLERGQDNV